MSDAKPSPGEPAMQSESGPTSLSEPGEVQNLAFGIAATLLALLAIYLSYRQLQAMRARHKVQTTSPDVEAHGAELLPFRAGRPQDVPDLQISNPPFLSARVLTLQQYVTTSAANIQHHQPTK